MKQRARSKNDASARRWARRLAAQVQDILAAHPSADPDNVRHTLILLEQPPLERLQRSLIRGRATAIFRNCVEISLGRRKLKVLALERILASKLAANRPKDKLAIPVLRDALAVTKTRKRRTKNR
jgi:hypothetical protein